MITPVNPGAAIPTARQASAPRLMAKTNERAAHFVAVVADADAPVPARIDRLRPMQKSRPMEGPMVEK